MPLIHSGNALCQVTHLTLIRLSSTEITDDTKVIECPKELVNTNVNVVDLTSA